MELQVATAFDVSPGPAEQLIPEEFDDPQLAPLKSSMRAVMESVGGMGSMLALRDNGGSGARLIVSDLPSSPGTGDRRTGANACFPDWPPGEMPDGQWTDFAVGERRFACGIFSIGLLNRQCIAAGFLLPTISLVKRQEVAESIRLLLPLIRAMVEMWATNNQLRQEGAALTAALDHSDVGIALLDSKGGLAFANRAATALLDSSDGIRRTKHSLSATDPVDSVKLRVAIDHAASCGRSRDPRHDPGTPILALRRSGEQRPLFASIIPINGTFSHNEIAAILYVIDPQQDITRVVGAACDLYGLSPVEKRLTCLLVNGNSLSEAAATMRIKEQTARTCLRQIFQKTDTNRQAQLIKLMLTSSIRLNSGDMLGMLKVL